MDCREFRKVLEGVMEGEPAPGALAHARECAACAGLVDDLRLIAHLGRTLEESDPPERVRNSIERQLVAEGLIGRARWLDRLVGGFGRLLPLSPAPALSAAYVLLLLLGLTLIFSEIRLPKAPSVAEKGYNAAPTVERASVFNGVDKELAQLESVALQRIAGSSPELHDAYASNLATVNESIRTCHDTLREDPENHSKREQLYAAYQQKAVVLESMLDPDLGM